MKNNTPKRRRSHGTKTADLYVTKIIITIERNSVTTKHPLYFGTKELSLKEMYQNGFLGDINFEHPSGVIENAELEAGPIGSFDGDEVGKFVFRLTRVGKGPSLNARVKKMNFFTTL